MSLSQSSFPSEKDLIESFEEDLTLRDLGGEAKRHYLAYVRIASSFLGRRGKNLLNL
ncbi:MAG: hypothetical protein V3V98_08480 [Thermoplasmata archaeon]